MFCPICSNNMILLGQGKILHKYMVHYFHCEHCGFIQTERPYWLTEAYSSAITRSDIGLVKRNIVFNKTAAPIILSWFNSGAQFIDYGGGYGLFVRLMRDSGFDFYRFDKYCENLFAQGFDADENKRNQYELLTAFEVFEHLVDPVLEIEQMLSYSRSIFFSTLLVPVSPPKISEWWYYGLSHGQHVSLYTQKSLELLARKFHLNLYTNGSAIHLLTEKKVSHSLFRLLCNRRLSLLINIFLKRKSLLNDDYDKLIKNRPG